MGFTYDPSGFMNVEDRECYCKDGFHPTLIGDSLDDGRYCIVHKLGFGGFATVWLARDSCRNEYVAIKILAASETRKTTELSIIKYLQGIKSNHTGKSHIAQMLSYFELLGPNGQHLCLVFDVLGPSIGSLRGDAELENHMKIKPDVTRDIAKQCQEGLSYLHECDLICIDLNAANILLKLAPINHLSTLELYDIFGRPRGQAMKLAYSDDPVGCAAPEFIYEPIAFSKIPMEFLVPEITFIDFGQMLRTSLPWDPEEIGYNAPYAAPELILMRRPSKEADIWALACILFELRAGRQLFRGFFGSEEEIVDSMEQILGDLPDSWMRQWETRRAHDRGDGAVESTPEYVEKDADSRQAGAMSLSKDAQAAHTTDKAGQPRAGYLRQVLSLIMSSFTMWLQRPRLLSANQSGAYENGSFATRGSLHQVIQEIGVWPRHLCRSAESRKNLILRCRNPGEEDQLPDLGWVDLLKPPPARLSREEAEDFESLLGGMLKYHPEERISLEEIKDHQWFSKSCPNTSEDDKWLERWF